MAGPFPRGKDRESCLETWFAHVDEEDCVQSQTSLFVFRDGVFA